MVRMVCIAALAFASVGSAQEWTRFRGPNGTGIGSTKGLPTSWSVKDLAWTTDLPGHGNSSPVLWGDAIFVTGTNDDNARLVSRVDAVTGAIAWTKSSPGRKYKMHARNTAATSTPAVDDQRVYILWGSPNDTTVQALTHQGEPVWSTDLGAFHGNHGIGASPIVYGDLLVAPNDQDSNGSLVALDSATGKIRWKLARSSGNATYATPCVYRFKGQPPRLIFTNWKHGVTAVDPETGKVAWETSVFEPMKQERSIASPIIAGDLVIGSCGFTTAQKHFVAVRPTGDGTAKEVWRIEKTVAHIPTPIVVGDHIYMVTETGKAYCIEAKSGTTLWSESLPGRFSSSPVSADGIVYVPSLDGEVFVFRASPKFELLGRGDLGHPTQATPAIAGGRMIFRTDSRLHALSAQAKGS